jgi:glycosyltransferase involved in cell wall biosynthesis
VGNGVNLTRFTPTRDAAHADADQIWLDQIGVQAQGPVWLAVGGIEARKNTTRLLQAFVQARRQCPQAQLVIAGGASLLDHDAETQAFQAVREAHGLGANQPDADRLLLTGPLPEGALPALYRRAAALAMPSLREGFGLVVLEALACGTPAIASRRPPFTEHLGEHDVLWTDPLDVADIARALLASLQTRCTAPILARARHVCERLSWQRSAASHESLYLQHLTCHA